MQLRGMPTTPSFFPWTEKESLLNPTPSTKEGGKRDDAPPSQSKDDRVAWSQRARKGNSWMEEEEEEEEGLLLPILATARRQKGKGKRNGNSPSPPPAATVHTDACTKNHPLPPPSSSSSHLASHLLVGWRRSCTTDPDYLSSVRSPSPSPQNFLATGKKNALDAKRRRRRRRRRKKPFV